MMHRCLPDLSLRHVFARQGGDYCVRAASVSDIDQLAPLYLSYLRFYEQPGSLEQCREYLTRRLAPPTPEAVVFCAELCRSGDAIAREQQLIGFVLMYPLHCFLGRTWLLNDLFVHPEARRGGVARKLLERAHSYARDDGAEWVELSTARTNTVAQSLYRSLGYELDNTFLRFSLPLKVVAAAP
eukprot:gnl/Spiro4/27605_TR13737_c0_g1_i1.p2 gnl/Spiro4/27605_TR13737_c0_g1~~gnl/Spiro4/27605_TR13737_c0_g1_i1.p2  ORF type:complete len:184 (-),score=50.88 gnl/Spiro4/27605_TR13737_c0_g1_i1:46-597(-)